MKKSALIVIANGSEDMETTTVTDIFDRAGIDVIVASVNEKTITTAHGLKITAHKLLQECKDEKYDIIALPGGLKGAQNLRDSDFLKEKLYEQKKSGRIFAAICASPQVVLNEHGLLGDKKATAYPGMTDSLPNQAAVDQKVVVDGNCITSRGPGTAIAFALTCVEQLLGKNKAQEVAKGLLVEW